jgi:hypothetical protein
MSPSEFFQQYICQTQPEFSVVIEDNGKVAYAYLLETDKIMGDVWLYNQAPTPTKNEWRKEDRPFLNPIIYLKDSAVFQPLKDLSEIDVAWTSLDNNIRAILNIRHQITVVLEKGAKPGWSNQVRIDGPLAKVLRQTASNKLLEFLKAIENRSIDQNLIASLKANKTLHPDFEERYLLKKNFKRFIKIHLTTSADNQEIYEVIETGGLPYQVITILNGEWQISTFRFQCQGCFGKGHECGVCGGSGWGVM